MVLTKCAINFPIDKKCAGNVGFGIISETRYVTAESTRVGAIDLGDQRSERLATCPHSHEIHSAATRSGARDYD